MGQLLDARSRILVGAIHEIVDFRLGISRFRRVLACVRKDWFRHSKAWHLAEALRWRPLSVSDTDTDRLRHHTVGFGSDMLRRRNFHCARRGFRPEGTCDYLADLGQLRQLGHVGSSVVGIGWNWRRRIARRQYAIFVFA
jgi:hypothetical protein